MVYIGSYGTVVSDSGSGYGKVDVLFDGAKKPRPFDYHRLVLAEQTTPVRASQMEALIQAIAPSQVSALKQMPTFREAMQGPKTTWQVEQEEIARKRALVAEMAKERKDAAYIQGKEKARAVLARLRATYPTQHDLDLEEASIHEGYEIWIHKNKERLANAYWR